ncbi:MAG: SdpI family protein [Caldisericum sp.]|uniref:SdpI family protein n=1 Tax=Caldisericum sp. TaxID=2499687 RepID=UPI003D0D8627
MLYYSIGMVLHKAKRNWFIGIRTPWILSPDTVWKKLINKGALLFKIFSNFSYLNIAKNRKMLYNEA